MGAVSLISGRSLPSVYELRSKQHTCGAHCARDHAELSPEPVSYRALAHRVDHSSRQLDEPSAILYFCSSLENLPMRRAAIVSPLRTGVGKFLGSLSSVPAEDLAAAIIRAVVDKSGVDPDRIDDVSFAQSYANSEAPCIGRWAALAADLPLEVPGFQQDRRCGGGLQAIATASMMVQTGAADVVVAGGVESMSNIEYYTTSMRGGSRAGNVTMYDRLDRGRERSQPLERFGPISTMIETAENLARDYQITREQSDSWAAQSHARAAAATGAGKFKDEMIEVNVPQRRGDPVPLLATKVSALALTWTA